ncbi:MAG: amidohydrolase family protein [Acetobacteraceae bacterium]|nr:amidohydrolase family protein [Acetobacteraceae bacterium]
MNIDAHVHYWQLARGDYDWLTPGSPLYRDFGPTDAAPCLDAAGIDGVVLVQAAATHAETEFLLAHADADPRILGVVGWLDMMADDAPARLATLAGHRKLRAIRPMWQDIADDDWLLHPKQTRAYEAIIDHSLAFDALARLRHLPNLLRLIDRHPALPIVIDHAAKPDIAGGGLASWRDLLRPLAAIPHVHCKLSGLLTEAAPGATLETILPYAETVFDLFGPDRLIFGSDWPVLTLRRDYATWWRWAHDLTRPLGPAAQSAIFGANAARFYHLDPLHAQSAS